MAGILDILKGLFNYPLPKLFLGDIFGGISLLCIGILYILGHKNDSFIITANTLGIGVGIISLIVLISYFIGYILGFKYEPTINIYLILGFLSILYFYKEKISKNIKK